jgi:uncharacterized protein YhfF
MRHHGTKEGTMESHWKAWTDAATEDKARRVAGWALSGFEKAGRAAVFVGTQPDEETGGHVLEFVVALDAPTWPEAVVELLATAQRLGSGWGLSGFIREEVEATTNSVSVPGVQMLLCSLRR